MMVIHYTCRYCGLYLGKLEGTSFHYEQLGFHKLTEKERSVMLEYDGEGDLHVRAICEDCYEAFLKNPANYSTDYIIH